MIRVLALSCLCWFSPILLAASPPRPAKLGQCVACHGEDGRSRIPGTPHLGGQDQTYLVNALNAYRRGDRQAQPMNSLANTLQPADIAAIARWYARQPAVVGKPAAR